ncbi:hypothetical protein ABZW11_11045 [Nonomuraea sp. NPDC004580]|uniref:hypothetical protein n=1 Tax=Nonomuraea sp. NPDC004580 TaxID=3154552 RepID=UPI0033AE5B6F
MSVPEYHGPHLGPLLPDRVELAWYKPVRRTPVVRVVAHTCDCQAITYELCAAAGHGFVRRTDREQGTVHETAWTLTAVARRTFEMILDGQAV